MTIKWEEILKTANTNNSVLLVLKDAEFDVEHKIEFLSVAETANGHIVADVKSDTIEGDTLWLKGKFGFQNGCLSLLNAAGKKPLEGNTYTFMKIESDKSPAGYAYRWQA